MRAYLRHRPILLMIAVMAFVASSVSAEVQIKVLEDGSRLVYNENETQRARRTSSRLLPVPRHDIRQLIDFHARRQGLAPRLVQAVVQVESGYNPRARSTKGAMGLMQLMPATARELRVTEPYDPDQNIRGGTEYLRRMLQRFSGDLTLALAAYNAGPTAVAKYRDVPPYQETRNYVRKVLGLYRHGSTPLLPSALVQDHARDVAQRHTDETRQAETSQRGGDPVFITRDSSGRIVVSTSPKSN